jgi:Flp pilus assembly protein TadG
MMNRLSKTPNAESGASLVEFAMLMPLLLLLILGIVEFGFLLGESNEIRHATREGARYAAVSNPDRTGDGSITNADVIDSVCDALDLNGATVAVQITGGPDRLDDGTITVRITGVTSLSGAPLISNLIPSTLESSATFRLEQDAEWTSFNTADVCP